MLKFKNITLVTAVDNVIDEARKAFDKCLSHAEFADQLFFTSKPINYNHAVKCEPINDIMDYNRFIIKQLPKQIETDYVLIVHWDGFIVNPDSWTNEFLMYDYCGAPWGLGLNGGNGGFSLRSKKLLDLSAELIEKVDYNEDVLVCTKFEQAMTERGIKYAPFEVNRHFSSEAIKNPNSFGFHNLNLNPQYRKYIYAGN